MIDIKIYDNKNKQWLEPMSIIFGNEGDICEVRACIPGADPISDGWYTIKGKDLKHIAIKGDIYYNGKLLPKTDDIF